MTTSPASPGKPGTRRRDYNIALFRERRDLQRELGALTEEGVSDAAARRRARVLRRRIDSVISEIVSSNMGLVLSYTRRFSGAATAENRSEFESAGLLGLMRAVDSYDPDAGAFSQWAFQPIRREVLRAVHNTDHQNLTLDDFERRPAILRAAARLRGVDESYGPSDEEVAALACVTVAQVRRVLTPAPVDSLEQPVGADGAQLSDAIESNDVTTEARVMNTLALAALQTIGLKALDSREMYVIVRRFGLDGEPRDKLTDIGTTLSLSRETVRQIEARALTKLQQRIGLRE